MSVKVEHVDSEEQTINLISECQALESLKIDFKISLDLILLLVLSNKLKHLKYLKLSGTQVGHSYQKVIMTCNDEHQNMIAHLEQSSIEKNVLSFPKLTELTLKQCPNIDSNWLLLFLKKCQNLRKVFFCDLVVFNRQSTGKNLLYIKKISPHLKVMKLYTNGMSFYAINGFLLEDVSETTPGVVVETLAFSRNGLSDVPIDDDSDDGSPPIDTV